MTEKLSEEILHQQNQQWFDRQIDKELAAQLVIETAKKKVARDPDAPPSVTAGIMAVAEEIALAIRNFPKVTK